MKLAIAAAAGWIGFYIADHALFHGSHVRSVARFLSSIGSAFAFR
jgi:putative NADH-flavin reductase